MGLGATHEPVSAAGPLDTRGRTHLLEGDPEPADPLADDQGIGPVQLPDLTSQVLGRDLHVGMKHELTEETEDQIGEGLRPFPDEKQAAYQSELHAEAGDGEIGISAEWLVNGTVKDAASLRRIRDVCDADTIGNMVGYPIASAVLPSNDDDQGSSDLIAPPTHGMLEGRKCAQSLHVDPPAGIWDYKSPAHIPHMGEERGTRRLSRPRRLLRLRRIP